MDQEAFDRLVMDVEGVRRQRQAGLRRWVLQGRVVAREVNPTHVVVRVPFEVRHDLVARHPEVFDVPTPYAKHMMVVANLAAGDAGAIEDAVEAAWSLQKGPR